MNKFLLMAAVFLCGCAASKHTVWVKSGADQNQFEAEKSVCMERSQLKSANTGVDQKVFGDCMSQNGWFLQDERVAPRQASPGSSELKQVFDDLAREKDARCLNDEFKPFFAKTACDPQGVTESQMSDPSYITVAEKSAFAKLRVEMRKSQERAMAAYKEYGGEKGVQSAELMETWYVFNDKNVDDLMEGKETWGAYNHERKALYVQLSAELKKLSGPK